MQIKVARYVRVYFYLALIFAVIACVVMYYEIGSLNYPTNMKETILTVGCIIFPFILPLFQLILCPRAFAIIKLEEDRICSILFGKMKCKIRIDREVYYKIIMANPEKLRGAKSNFIIVSNEPFVYEERKKGNFGIWEREILFENCYDMTRMILIPYNEKTKQLFPIEKWINI